MRLRARLIRHGIRMLFRRNFPQSQSIPYGTLFPFPLLLQHNPRPSAGKPRHRREADPHPNYHSKNCTWSWYLRFHHIAARRKDRPRHNIRIRYIWRNPTEPSRLPARYTHPPGKLPHIWDERNDCMKATGCRQRPYCSKPEPDCCPLAAGYFINSPPQHAKRQVILILAGGLASLTA